MLPQLYLPVWDRIVTVSVLVRNPSLTVKVITYVPFLSAMKVGVAEAESLRTALL